MMASPGKNTASKMAGLTDEVMTLQKVVNRNAEHEYSQNVLIKNMPMKGKFESCEETIKIVLDLFGKLGIKKLNGICHSLN